MKYQKGFTLIEVLITMAILSTMVLLVAQTTQQAIKSKVKIQSQIDDVSKIRDALKLMERDVNLAFHYRDIYKELKELLKKKQKAAQQTPTQTQQPTQPTLPTIQEPQEPPEPPPAAPPIDPTTYFIGDSESMSFPTMNNARMVKNSPQADFSLVGYQVKECKSLSEKVTRSKCLWRRSSPHVGPDMTKGGEEIVLLENISEFKLRYMGKGKEDWGNDWASNEKGDGATKGKFPDAVEISLTVEKTEKAGKKKFAMQIIAPIHFPNNKQTEESTDGTSTQKNETPSR